MASIGSRVKWFLVVLIAVLLWADLLAVSVLFPAQSMVLDKNTWISVVEKTDWYDAFVPMATRFLQQDSGTSGTLLPAQTLESLVRQSFSREWLNAELAKVISNYFDFIDGKTETIDFSFSLQEPKQKIVQNLPQSGLDPLAMPLLETAVQQLPGRFELVQAEQVRNSLLEQRAMVAQLHQIVLLLLVAAVALAVLITALLQNRTVLLALGIIFLLAGLMVLVISQLTISTVPAVAKQLELQLQSQPPSTISLDLQGILKAIVNPFSNQVALFGISEIIIGLGSMIGFWFLRSRKPVTAATK